MANQYVVDSSSQNIQAEEQQRVDGKVFFVGVATVLVICALLFLSFSSWRRPKVEEVKEAVKKLDVSKVNNCSLLQKKMPLCGDCLKKVFK